jgi:DNA mismatch repair ATPase MutL
LDLLTAIRNYDQDCQKAGGEQLLEEAELIAQLRPRKIHGILALKACKGAVFIGEVLSKRTMRDLIDHLRPLRRPWICAHGRPTMRYLLNFDNFRSEFALPSKVTVDKNKYCSLSRDYR